MSQSPIRVVILYYMDHIIIIIGEWRSDAICNDPRLWINHGSTMDQHGSAWIKRPSASCRHGAFVMCHDSCVMRSALSPFSVLTPDSCVRRPCVLTHASTHVACVMRPDSCVHSRGMRQAFSRSIQPLHSAPRHGAGGLVIGFIL